MIRHNWRYKLLALAVALIVWTYVNSERNPQSRQTFTVPVKAINPTRGYMAELETPKVSVKVEGLKTSVDSVAKEDVEAQVDLRGLRPGKKIIEAMLPVEVHLPRVADSGLEVTPTPPKMKVRLEMLTNKRMPVEVSFSSDPPLGYSYSSPLLTPDTVTMSGRVTQLARVSKAILTISGDPAGSPTDDYYDVTPIDADGNVVAGVSAQQGKVRAKLEMVEAPATKAVIVSPVFSGQPKFPSKVSKYTVTPSSVTLVGKPSALGGISAISTEKVVLEGADAIVTRDVALRVPRGVRAVGTKTVKVIVYIGAD